MTYNYHGLAARGAQHPLYRVWCNMRNRCLNPNNPFFPSYGGRGVKICNRWDNFGNFVTDVGERPPGTFFDRINPDGDYEPTNVRWLPPGASTKNRRRYGALERFTTEELLAELARRGVK